MTRNLLAVLILIAIAASAFGHHSEAAEYEANKPVKVTGIIKKVDFAFACRESNDRIN